MIIVLKPNISKKQEVTILSEIRKRGYKQVFSMNRPANGQTGVASVAGVVEAMKAATLTTARPTPVSTPIDSISR